jgi:hypothetical protein
MRTVRVDFGRGGLEITVPDGVDVLRPRSAPGLADAEAALWAEMRNPGFGTNPRAAILPEDPQTIACVV